jgi:hypothetical protein
MTAFRSSGWSLGRMKSESEMLQASCVFPFAQQNRLPDENLKYNARWFPAYSAVSSVKIPQTARKYRGQAVHEVDVIGDSWV